MAAAFACLTPRVRVGHLAADGIDPGMHIPGPLFCSTYTSVGCLVLSSDYAGFFFGGRKWAEPKFALAFFICNPLPAASAVQN
jgi:hypothetical protein